ncbi:class I adenylate-forming enzyme family protein [Paracandidimonas lactea]|uniref:class I adenylate-forming enzyme family protein n=1 Tax=Paracandidimonas lactea TaxID=2895524 RepID=UPI001EF01FCB|nr:class I adenylate-forming enzyme family protein [Paracandidimonas lactea]
MATTFQARGPDRIHLLVDEWARTHPGLPALQDATLALSYGELAQASLRAADRLRELDVRGGDRVVIVGENCAAACAVILGLSRMDAWSCFVNARLSAREIDQVVAHSGARRVLYTCHVSDSAEGHARRHGAVSMDWDGLGSLHVGPLAEAVLLEAVSPSPTEQVAALVYTSGTSGAPKAVMLTHANLMFPALWSAHSRGLAPGDIVYGVLPMAHIIGLASQFIGSMSAGATVMLEPRFDVEAATRALAEGGVTLFTGVPAMFARLLDHAQASGVPLRAPALRYISVGGSPLTPRLKADTEAALGLTLHNGYGLTEAAPTIAQTRRDAPRSDCSVGPPIVGVEIRIVDGDGGAVTPGEIGTLHMRSPGVMKGYYRDAGRTAEILDAEGWLNTGDMAQQSADGALHIVGRSKELIIRSGFNVYPVEVEQVINSHPAVVQSAVVGREVEHNEEVVAFVELKRNMQAPDPDAFRDYLRARLSPYKVPCDIRFVEQMPMASTGKLLKNVLKSMAQERASGVSGQP